MPIAWLIAALWPLLGRRLFGHDRLPPVGDVMIVLGTLSLPQFAAGIQVLPFVTNHGFNVDAENGLRFATVASLLLAAAFVGLLWRPRVWLIAAAAFFVPFVLLFTTFFTNQPGPWTDVFWQAKGGFFSGIWGSLDYWLDQQDVRRGNQPNYYYALLTPLYEFLPLLLASAAPAGSPCAAIPCAAGSSSGPPASSSASRSPARRCPGSRPTSSYHSPSLPPSPSPAPSTPSTSRDRRWLTAAATALLTGLAVFLVVEADATLPRLLGWAVLAGLLGWLVASIGGGAKGVGRVALTIGVAALFSLTLRAGIIASFQNDDTPAELFVYTQTAPDIPELRDQIDAVAAESGLGLNLPIVVDNASGFAWPWAWYLRDYHSVSFAVADPDYEPPPGAVLLIADANVANIDPSGYAQSSYKHRWWFAETYRGLTFSSVVATLTSPDGLNGLGDFFINRRPLTAATSGSVGAVAFFPTDLAGFDGASAPAAPAPTPTLLGDGRIVVGRQGGARGELRRPADVFVDNAGAIWVADAGNGRLQKFDAEGRFLLATGRNIGGATALSEPWSVAVNEDGFVYVADTWNHRVLKFSPTLELVASWGRPATQPDPGPLELFGPRDIVLAADGTLWLTDTGNKRLVHYDRDGAPLGTYGGAGAAPGEFSEPVGLAFDGEGRLLVADAWNGRIQRLAPDLAAAVAFATGWTSRDAAAKPYLAVLADGRILASDPAQGALLLFDAAGAPLGAWHPAAGSRPLGVAALTTAASSSATSASASSRSSPPSWSIRSFARVRAR